MHDVENVNERAGKIVNKLSDLISQAEELKIDNGTIGMFCQAVEKRCEVQIFSID